MNITEIGDEENNLIKGYKSILINQINMYRACSIAKHKIDT